MTEKKMYGTLLTLTLIDPRNGNQLWHGANGRNYIRVSATGRWVLARLA